VVDDGRLRGDGAGRGHDHGRHRARAVARAAGSRARRPEKEPGMSGRVWFVGAGPGAPDLLTLRAVRVLGEADIVIWARSLVDEGVLAHARDDAELIASDDKTFEDVVA